MPLMRFDPFGELERVTQQLSRQKRQSLPMDAVRDDEAVTIYFDVPGVTRDDLDITVERNELTVTATRRWSDDSKTTLVSERTQGEMTREIILGESLDLEQLKAKLDAGVLTISIPIDVRSSQRKIEISDGTGSEQVIEAETNDAASTEDD